jgi:hypothetical protein
LTELSDMAVKSLSTGPNDPTTAEMCIDRLGETLVELGARPPPARVRTGARGRVWLITPGVNFDRAVEQAFDGIRRYATTDAAVMAGLLDMLGRVARRVREEYRPPLEQEVARALSTADESFDRPPDRRLIARAAEDALRELGCNTNGWGRKENVGEEYFRRMLDAGAVDVLQADITRCLGVSGILDAGALCAARSVPLSGHAAPWLHTHPLCAVDAARHVEYFHDHVRIGHLLFEGLPELVQGALRPDPSRPGQGLELKRQDAERFRV